MKPILKKPCTIMPRADARAVAERLNQEARELGDSWTYEAVEHAHGYSVAVWDQDGIRLGML